MLIVELHGQLVHLEDRNFVLRCHVVLALEGFFDLFDVLGLIVCEGWFGIRVSVVIEWMFHFVILSKGFRIVYPC